MLCRKLGGLATHQRVVHPVQGTTSRPEFRITVATAPAANELVQPRNVRGAGAVMHAKVYRDPPPELLTVERRLRSQPEEDRAGSLNDSAFASGSI
jgi:hypothetical protein